MLEAQEAELVESWGPRGRWPLESHQFPRRSVEEAQQDHAQALFNRPIKMRYEDLDPEAEYKLKAVYAGRFNSQMRLVADGKHEIHAELSPEMTGVLKFAIPREATRDGVLDLEWQLIPDPDSGLYHRSRKRGCQVSEVWLVKK